jgi:rhodanese-related sulfurtransferase
MQHNPGFLALVESRRPHVRDVSIEAMRDALRDGTARVIDVREDSEWAAGHAPGAEHIGKGVIERDIETRVPDPSTPVLLYCGGGFRSVLSADVLQRMGYTNVASVDGGWRAWVAAGGAVATDAAS